MVTSSCNFDKVKIVLWDLSKAIICKNSPKKKKSQGSCKSNPSQSSLMTTQKCMSVSASARYLPSA